NPAIPGTIEAAALSKMSERGQITGAVVEGPLGFDIAISIEAAKIKRIDLHNRRRPDILIMSNLEAGNLLYRHLAYLAQAECARVAAASAYTCVMVRCVTSMAIPIIP